MFTGIVTDIGRIVARQDTGGITRLEIDTKYDTGPIPLGASIACAGVCLTVVAKEPGRFAVELSGETLARTTAAGWSQGTRLNLERALKMGDELGGHLVSGHVDGTARLTGSTPDGESRRLDFTVDPPELAAFIATKGSVTLDGVSLTVNAVTRDGFGVTIIPHTLAATTLGALQPADRVNLEIDQLARYIARMIEMRQPTP